MGRARFICRALAFAIFLLFSLCAHAGAPQLQDISFVQQSGKQVDVVLSFNQPVLRPKSFVIKKQSQLVLDFKGAENTLEKPAQLVEMGYVNRYDTVTADGRTRVVLGLSEDVHYTVSVVGKKVHIYLGFSNKDLPAVAGGAGTLDKFSEPVVKYGMHATAGQSLEKIDFRKDPLGGGRVEIVLSQADIATEIKQEGDRVIVDFHGASVPRRLQQRLDVTDFGTPVQFVDALNVSGQGRVVVHSLGQFQHMAYQINDHYVIEVKPLQKNVPVPLAKRHYTGERLSLNFQDIKIRAVLQLLAEFTGLNMVVSDSVTGSITLRLKDVPWDQALDIIMKTQGLAKRDVGNVLIIAPQEEISAREKKELRSIQQIEELVPLQSELIQINYAKAEEIASLLASENNENMLLSARGSVSVDKRTNTVWVQETPEKILQIRDFVRKLDIPVRQVLIEARIVTVGRSFEKELGVRFGLSHDGGTHLSGTLEGANTLAVPGNGPTAASVANRLNVDLPASIVTGTPGTIGLALAKLGGSVLLDMELSALEAESQGKVIASPRVVTANQKLAHIEKGEEIPFQESTSSGATSISFKKAVLSLDVTPQITPDDRVILNLRVTQDTKGEATISGPAINTQQVETQVLVNNGETLVLGGIYEEAKNHDVKRIPFFGDLPVIGKLFTTKHYKNERDELLIFITPKIIKQNSVT